MPNEPKFDDTNVVPEAKKPLESQGQSVTKVETPAVDSDLEKLRKHNETLMAENAEFREFKRQAKQAQKDAEEKALQEQGKWEDLAKTKDNEIQNQFKPALEALQNENNRLKKAVVDLSEAEMKMLPGNLQEKFNKLFPNINDPLEKLEKLRIFKAEFPTGNSSPHVNAGQPSSMADYNSQTNNVKNIHANGNPQQRAQLYGQVANRLDTHF